MKIWVIGPVAWDTVVYCEEPIKKGGFVQGVKTIERPGGTGANVARALASTKFETGFFGYLGNDEIGQKLEKDLIAHNIRHLELTRVADSSSHVLIIVEGDGDRTILGLAKDNLQAVNLDPSKLERGDIVVFVLWREHFLKDLELARAAGCQIVVGLDAVNDPRVGGIEAAIGSINDVAADFDAVAELGRFNRIVITRGVEGATEYSAGSEIHQKAFPANSIDATGAGDAFLAGYLTAMANGDELAEQRLALGARWAAKAVETESSVPPAFSTL